MKKGSAEVFCGSSLEILFLFFFHAILSLQKEEKKNLVRKNLLQLLTGLAGKNQNMLLEKNR